MHLLVRNCTKELTWDNHSLPDLLDSSETACHYKGQVNKLTSIFHVSVLLLIINFVITLSK